MWRWFLGMPIALAIRIAVALSLWVWLARRGFGRTGRIEGVLYVDGKPAPAGQWVGCSLSREIGISTKDSSQFVMWNEFAETTEDGHFEFGRIPVGKIELGIAYPDEKSLPHRFGGDPSSEAKVNLEKTVTVSKGETQTVVLGKDGLTVRGRFVLADKSEADVDWSLCEESFMSGVAARCPEPPEHLSSEERANWWREFTESKEYLAWREALQRFYHVRPDSDGGFSVQNVSPGTYRLQARIDSPIFVCKRGSRRPLGTYDNTVEVPALDDNDVVSMDLGKLVMARYALLETRSPIPDLIVRTLDDDDIDFKTYRGNYLMLYVWRDTKFEEKKFLRGLARLRDRFESKIGLNILGLDMEPEDSNAHLWMEEINAHFDHRDVAEEDTLRLSTALGVLDTTLFLVDPEGVIVAIEEEPKRMETRLQQVLEGPNT